MKFKTTIQIVTDASDKNEAMEIAGEYLSGHLHTGVDMICKTRPVASSAKRTMVFAAVFFLVALLSVNLASFKQAPAFICSVPGNNVIQPPLKTSSEERQYADFKKRWQVRQLEEALGYIKK